SAPGLAGNRRHAGFAPAPAAPSRIWDNTNPSRVIYRRPIPFCTHSRPCQVRKVPKVSFLSTDSAVFEKFFIYLEARVGESVLRFYKVVLFAPSSVLCRFGGLFCCSRLRCGSTASANRACAGNCPASRFKREGLQLLAFIDR